MIHDSLSVPEKQKVASITSEFGAYWMGSRMLKKTPTLLSKATIDPKQLQMKYITKCIELLLELGKHVPRDYLLEIGGEYIESAYQKYLKMGNLAPQMEEKDLVHWHDLLTKTYWMLYLRVHFCDTCVLDIFLDETFEKIADKNRRESIQ